MAEGGRGPNSRATISADLCRPRASAFSILQTATVGLSGAYS